MWLRGTWHGICMSLFITDLSITKVIAHVYFYMYAKQKKYSKLSSISTTATQGVIRKEGEWKATHLSAHHKIPSPSYCYCKNEWKAPIVVTRHWKSERTWSPDPSLFVSVYDHAFECCFNEILQQNQMDFLLTPWHWNSNKNMAKLM